MLAKRGDINKDFNEYAKTVQNYVETGAMPSNLTKKELLKKISNLSQTEKEFLRETIKWELPMDDWAYLGPLLENIPKAAKWAALFGVSGGVAQYRVSNNFYSATTAGLLTGAVTFFGQQQYKNYQIKNLWNSREERANEFLEHLPERKGITTQIAQN